MEQIVKRLMLLTLVSSSGIFGYGFEFRSPLSYQRPQAHWPLYPVQQAFWFPWMPDGRDDESWQIQSWITTYTRSAENAYWNPEKNKNTTKIASLAVLFFGKETFTVEEAFVNGIVTTPSNILAQNPAIAFSHITPHLEYTETGAVFGVMFDKTLGCNDMWHIGSRLSLPVVVVDIDQDVSLTEIEQISDVVRYRLINLDEGAKGNNYEFAYRADFLSTLAMPTIVNEITTAQVPMLRIDNNLVFLAEQTLSGTDSGRLDSNNNNPAAYVVKRSTQTYPPVPLRKTPDQVTSALAANGSGTDDTAYFFSDGTDYSNLLKDRTTLSTLFIVPRGISADAEEGITANSDITEESVALSFGNGILWNNLSQYFTELGSQTAEEFLFNQGIDILASERIIGVGDMEWEVYGGYGDRNCWFVDLTLGLRFPTGKRQKNSTNVFFVSTGHNGHFELKAELEGGWRPCNYFAFKIDGSVSHAFRRTEHRAARFTGSTVNNIGPAVDAKVSWTYFIVHADFNFFHPYNDNIGMMLGYEFYARRKDHIKYEEETAKDFAGQTGTLDATAAAARTNAIANKLRGEFFHRWNYFELSLGLSHIVSGRSITKETEAHVTFDVYF